VRPPVVLGSSAELDPIAHLSRLAAGPFAGCELRVDPDDGGWLTAAAATGWVDAGARERWSGPLSDRPIDPQFTALAELGEGRFIALLAATLPAEQSQDRFDDWGPLRSQEREMWGAVGPAVLVPRLIEPGLGALLHIVVPKAIRGQGWGRRAYDTALGLLYRAGARRYEDETDSDNRPMLRLFATAGMERVGRWRRLIRSGQSV